MADSALGLGSLGQAQNPRATVSLPGMSISKVGKGEGSLGNRG